MRVPARHAALLFGPGGRGRRHQRPRPHPRRRPHGAAHLEVPDQGGNQVCARARPGPRLRDRRLLRREDLCGGPRERAGTLVGEDRHRHLFHAAGGGRPGLRGVDRQASLRARPRRAGGDHACSRWGQALLVAAPYRRTDLFRLDRRARLRARSGAAALHGARATPRPHHERRGVQRAPSALLRAHLRQPALRPGPRVATTMATNPVLVEVLRGDMVESTHRGAAAVVSVDGSVPRSWGDIESPVYPRSAIKPLQAIPLVETGAADHAAPRALEGCGIPMYGIPLVRLALCMARLVAPASLPPRRADAARRVCAAMTTRPELVVGPGRLSTMIMEITGGAVIVKGGTEGVFLAAIRDRGMGLAVKIDDGSQRAVDVALLAILNELGVLSPEHLRALSDRLAPELRNGSGTLVETIRVRMGAALSALTFFPRELGHLSDGRFEDLLRTAGAAPYAPWLGAVRAVRGYLLTDAAERQLAEESAVQRMEWVGRYDRRLHALCVPTEHGSMSVGAALHLHTAADLTARESTARTLATILDANIEDFTLILNALVERKQREDRRRGLDRPNTTRNCMNRLDDEVVDAIIVAARVRAPLAHQFYRLNASGLGEDVLDDWDLLAP